jgi:hypothetical protein
MLCPAVYGDPSNMLFYCLFVCSEFQKRVLFFFLLRLRRVRWWKTRNHTGILKTALFPRKNKSHHTRGQRAGLLGEFEFGFSNPGQSKLVS